MYTVLSCYYEFSSVSQCINEIVDYWKLGSSALYFMMRYCSEEIDAHYGGKLTDKAKLTNKAKLRNNV